MGEKKYIDISYKVEDGYRHVSLSGDEEIGSFYHYTAGVKFRVDKFQYFVPYTNLQVIETKYK